MPSGDGGEFGISLKELRELMELRSHEALEKVPFPFIFKKILGK